MHNKVLKKICNIFLDILIGIFGVILVVTIYNDIQVKVFNKDYADFFGYSTFEVQTGSMAPAINANDLIIVKESDSFKIRDIVTYKKGNDFITHRVVESYKETYVTRGDANNAKDEAITKDQIVGKVVKVIPNFGALRQTILNPFVLITLIITIYIISRLFSNKKSIFSKYLSKLSSSKEKAKKEEKIEILEEEKPVSINITPDDDGLIRASLDEEEKEEELDDEKIEELKKALEDVEIENTEEGEDAEKTVYFRKVSVDSKDLNPEPPKIIEVVEEEPVIVNEEVDETIEEEKLKTIKKKHKRFNNIVEKAMSIKQEELNEIITVLDEERLKPNEATIKEAFLKIYIDGKYYNHCGDVAIDYNLKNMCSKIEDVLNKESARMIKGYIGNDTKFEYKVLKYKAIFTVLINLEHIDSLYDDVNTKVDNYKKKISKYINYEEKDLNNKIKEIINIQKVYKKILNDALEGVDTTTFELHYNQLSTNKNIYGLVLDHNISFSKVYSNYIISKTYDEGVVAEDKILVLLSMLLNKIAKDMVSGNFKNKYLLYLPVTLYEKETKLNHILKILNDEFVKNSVLILAKSSVAVSKKKLFRDIKKLGYQIGIVYDNNELKGKDNSIYSVATYIFIDKKIGRSLNFDLIDKNAVILENIMTKVDIPRGEE